MKLLENHIFHFFNVFFEASLHAVPESSSFDAKSSFQSEYYKQICNHKENSYTMFTCVYRDKKIYLILYDLFNKYAIYYCI
jgi:hypothetical protein